VFLSGTERGKVLPLWPLAAGLLLALVVASLATGASSVSFAGLFSPEDAGNLLLVSRLPRTLAALLSGASLAVAGVIMQALVRNRFVEPGTTGTVECAALGLLATTLLVPAAPLTVKMIVSSAAALAGAALFLALVRRLPVAQPLLVPLTGLIYGGTVLAATEFIAYEYDLLQYLSVWTAAEFSGVMQGRYELLWLSGSVAVFAYFFADRFTIAGFGRDAAVGLGLNYTQVLIAGLSIVALITSFTIITVGMIPFVGLVVPNIVSRYKGDNTRETLPLIAFVGAALVLASDLAGRLINYPYEIPVGIVFGILGTVVFLWLLFSRPVRNG